MDQGLGGDSGFSSGGLPSKQARAMEALGTDAFAAQKPRRLRRRRRSLRKRLLDGVMPFLIVFGMTVLAAGLVEIVEVGAAGNSKRSSDYEVEPLRVDPRETAFDYESAQRAYNDMMRQHADLRRRATRPVNQVAYQLQMENEAVRELNGLPPAPPAKPGSQDILDWELLDESSPDPRSVLKRGTSPLEGLRARR